MPQLIIVVFLTTKCLSLSLSGGWGGGERKRFTHWFLYVSSSEDLDGTFYGFTFHLYMNLRNNAFFLNNLKENTDSVLVVFVILPE